jgi:hypothetical protein
MNRLALVLASVAALGITLSVHAQTSVNWANPASGDFSDNANWSPSVVPQNGQPNPGDTYNADIDAVGAAYTVTLASPVTLELLTLDSADAQFRHTLNTLEANAGIELLSGEYLLDGGTITNTTIN